MCVQYRGVYLENRGGFSVLWGDLEYCGDFLSTVGDIMGIVGDILSTVGVYHDA